MRPTLLTMVNQAKPHIIGYDDGAREVLIRCNGVPTKSNPRVSACLGPKQVLRVKMAETQLVAWAKGGKIQLVAPHLTSDERELLISGTCPTCWEALFR